MRWRMVAIETFLLSGLSALLLYSGVGLARWQPEASGAGPGALQGIATSELKVEEGYDEAPCRRGAETPDLSSAGLSVFPLLTEVSFDTGDGSTTRRTVEGSGTVLFHQFVLTVAHAVTVERLETTVKTYRGDMKIPVDSKRVSEVTYLIAPARRIPLAALARREEADVALFLLPVGSELPSFPYPIGNSEALELGDYVALLGSDSAAGVLFRPASVAALRSSAAVATLSRSERVFLISVALTEGESGTPILALRRGSYELVGLAQGTYIGPRQLAWGIRIGAALEALSHESEDPGIRRFLRLCCQSGVVELPVFCTAFAGGGDAKGGAATR